MSARKTTVTVASAAALCIACTSVKQFEGYAPKVVPDHLAGGLPTGGYGETVGVRLGETHSEKYWSDRLQRRLADTYDREIGECITAQLPDGVRAMAISLSYNAGAPAVCRSPMVRLWNKGDVLGGCRAILTKDENGNYTGWRISSRPNGPGTPLVVQRGLINRRAKERRKCLDAARAPKPPAVEAPAFPAPLPAPVVVATAPAPAVEPAPAPTAPAKVSWGRRIWCAIFKCEVKS